ncbi:MAG: mammalian cell entry protein [Rubrivivax sp.]|nr:mammalian cell entry protein [Rubrivivax sp.]
MSDEPTPPPLPVPTLPPSSGREERRATALLLLLAALVLASVLYVLYARGAFEPTQRLVLMAEDSEGVVVGMDLTFSGFPIGRVRRTELAADGNVRILVDVPRKDAHWLRTSSVFTMTRGLVGGTAIRAYSGILTDPPLPDGAERPVLAGDASAEIPRLMSAARDLLANLGRLTADESALSTTLANLQRATGRLDEQLAGKRGALGALLGDDAPQVAATLARTQQLLTRLDGLVQRTDGVIARADGKLLGDKGLVDDAQAAVRQLEQLLAEARTSLRKVDGLLQDAQAVAANARVASADLGALRAEVDASLRKVEQLVNDLERRWPFKRDPELKLP